MKCFVTCSQLTQDLGHDSVIGESIVSKINKLTSTFFNLSQEINNVFTLFHGDVKKSLLNMVYVFMESLIMHFLQLILDYFWSPTAHDVFQDLLFNSLTQKMHCLIFFLIHVARPGMSNGGGFRIFLIHVARPSMFYDGGFIIVPSTTIISFFLKNKLSSRTTTCESSLLQTMNF